MAPALYAETQRRCSRAVGTIVKKIRVLYFTAVSLSAPDGGGAVCCRNHVQRMASEPNIELTVVVTGPGASEDGNRAYVTSVGASFSFLPWKEPSRLLRRIRRIPRVLTLRYPLLLEPTAFVYRHVDSDFRRLMLTVRPDVVVIDYLPSAHFVRSAFESSVPTCLITLNRETDFLRDLWKMRDPPGSELGLLVSTVRSALFERWLNNRINGFVALTVNDLPKLPGSVTPAVIPPFLEPRSRQWSYGETSSGFFVGSIHHYPNRLAMEWICTRLAPEVERLTPKFRFRLIGALPEEVPETWRRASIDFLGRASADEVERQFTSADVFIAPIENTYGSKIKLLECVSYGTPCLASRAAMSGLPFITSIPEIDLNDPVAAARLLHNLTNSPAALAAMSEATSKQLGEFKLAQQQVWSRFFRQVLENQNHRASKRRTWSAAS